MCRSAVTCLSAENSKGAKAGGKGAVSAATNGPKPDSSVVGAGWGPKSAAGGSYCTSQPSKAAKRRQRRQRVAGGCGGGGWDDGG
eukprot:4907263-Karenia_brevis.AAC.1